MLSTGYGDRASLQLSDGSSVFLAPGGSLDYPEKFNQDQRTVVLDGEAFFDVARDEDHGFVVMTDYANISVLGTSFAVVEDDDLRTVEVFVSEGSVRLQPEGSDVYVDLKAGEYARYDDVKGELTRPDQDDLNDIAWHTRRLVFKNTPLKEVVEDLEKTFGVEITVQNDAMFDCTFNSNYTDESIDNIFSDMADLWGISTISTAENKYVIQGGTSCD